MHNDCGGKQPVQCHEANIIPWGNAYISDVHNQNHDRFIDVQPDVATPRCIVELVGLFCIYHWNIVNVLR